MRRTGFTLVELLVVVAIVAILAAILFPVFSQVRDSARDATTLSNVRQIGLANLIYAGDHEDMLPLAWKDDPAGANTWQHSIQPYAKSWEVLVHPKVQKPEGPHAAWQNLQHFGMMPKIETIATSASEYKSNLGALTNRETVHSRGILGAGTRGMYGYRQGSTPSLTLGSIQDPGVTLLVSEAGNWDFLMGVFAASQPFSFCAQNGTWGAERSAYPGLHVYAGPHARRHTVDDRSGTSKGCKFPDGVTTYVAADGSAKAMDFRTRVLEREQLSDGRQVFKRFWP